EVSWKASSGFGESTAHALTRGMGWGSLAFEPADDSLLGRGSSLLFWMPSFGQLLRDEEREPTSPAILKEGI
ncbi:MAG: hypothetical protein LM575_07850, partial [Caldimicrobium sp.]|nr:hypothetical protein [Caldimicrobium sp.]